MEKAAIAFIFPNPDNSLEFGLLVQKAKDAFADQPDVRIFAAVKNAAEQIEAIFETAVVDDQD